MSYLKLFLGLASLLASMAILIFVGAPQYSYLLLGTDNLLSQLGALFFVMAAVACCASVTRSHYRNSTIALGIFSVMAAFVQLGWFQPALDRSFSTSMALVATINETVATAFPLALQEYPNATVFGLLILSCAMLLPGLKACENLVKLLQLEGRMQYLGLIYASIGLMAVTGIAQLFSPSHALVGILLEAIQASAALAILLSVIAIPRHLKPAPKPKSLESFTAVKGY